MFSEAPRLKRRTLNNIRGKYHFSFITITEAGDHEVNILEAVAIYIMAQTAPSDKGFLWYSRKCFKDRNLDCNISVCSGSSNKELEILKLMILKLRFIVKRCV